MKYVRIIPAIPKEKNKKLKVAAYCRVSTSGSEQLCSLENQIKTYTKMIRNHPDWLFAGVFFDIESGLRRGGRDGLDKMLKKAEKGKIDYIITKSNQQGIKRYSGGFEDYKIFKRARDQYAF